MTGPVHSRSAAAVPDAPAGSAGTAPIPDPRRPPATRPPKVVFPGFDGLRAIAALLVVVVHTSFPAGFTTSSGLGPYTARGEAGVAVFFLISGFLLYRPFVAARLAGVAAAAAPGYLVRRFMRIVPLYWVALAVTLNVVSDERVGVHGLAGVFQTAFFLQGYQDLWAIQGLTQAWTLDIEVAFYLAVPVYAWLLGRRRRSPEAQVRVELAALAVTFLAAKLVHFLVIPSKQSWMSGWNVWLPVWWDLFAMGMALAVISARYAQLGRQPRWAGLRGSGTACWAVAALFYWVASRHAGLPLVPIFDPDRAQDMNRHLLYGLFGFFLLLPAVFGRQDRGAVRPLLASRPLAFLGAISYGIYLWHSTVIDLVLEHSGWRLWKIPYPPFLLVVLGLTVAVATATHHLIERPCIRLAHGWARRADAWVARRRGRAVAGAGTAPADGAPSPPTPTGAFPAAVTGVMPGVAIAGMPGDSPTVPLLTGSAARPGGPVGRQRPAGTGAAEAGAREAADGWVPRAWRGQPGMASGAERLPWPDPGGGLERTGRAGGRRGRRGARPSRATLTSGPTWHRRPTPRPSRPPRLPPAPPPSGRASAFFPPSRDLTGASSHVSV
ncbi:acyltransferase [Frankia sp. QA3]|uniref:acyltransferase family protein n=1 Tax=Frankia sp. QA3 TaxID=710111 RepID=UPI000269C661|nr:acyltransferase [Frankia sp. QA3]EIV93571.1 putative acyltransferase [Frankia sp. QA3]